MVLGFMFYCFTMPRKYVRTNRVIRGQWTEENLILAVEKVKKGEISKNEAQRRYGIPIRTLSRRLKTGNTKKSGLGPQGINLMIICLGNLFITSCT